jgi:hypothetical protein
VARRRLVVEFANGAFGLLTFGEGEEGLIFGYRNGTARASRLRFSSTLSGVWRPVSHLSTFIWDFSFLETSAPNAL